VWGALTAQDARHGVEIMNPKMNRARGKRTEQALAKRLNGKRLGLLGNEDVSAGPFSVEVKSRAAFVGMSWMEQSVRNCREGKTPLVIVHLTGKRHDGDLVLMRLKDWQDWHGKIEGRSKA